jgi:uncharacterized membrane protein
MMFGYGGHGDWWVLMLIGMFVFAGLIIWAIYAFSRRSARPSQFGNSPEDARTVLDQRLSRDEIDDQECTKLRDLIAPADEASVTSLQSRG